MGRPKGKKATKKGKLLGTGIESSPSTFPSLPFHAFALNSSTGNTVPTCTFEDQLGIPKRESTKVLTFFVNYSILNSQISVSFA